MLEFQGDELSAYTLKNATEADFPAIRRLIRTVGINPTSLDWRRFVIALDRNGELIGCGQVKPHRDGSRELASIAVKMEWRGRGVARAIIERLIAENPRPLYLTCRASLGPFYERFGFLRIDDEKLPAYFRWVHRAVRLMQRLKILKEGLLVMKLE